MMRPRSRTGAEIVARFAASSLLFILLGWPGPGSSVAAQSASPLARIEAMEVGRVEVGRATVLYSLGAEDPAELEASARRLAGKFEDAATFFAGQLELDFSYTVALLSPRHWTRVGDPRHALPWSSEEDRLVVVPVRSDMALLLPSGRDTARARPVLDIISYHQLGHVVAAAYLHPTGFHGPPPVRWFSELLASYLGHWYMRETRPDLADFSEELAYDVTGETEPRFSSLHQYDAYHDVFLTSPQGANTRGWYQNAFNLWAAELYDDFGGAFIRRVREELPWVRLETWTTASLLDELEAIVPGFGNWAREMAAASAPGYR
jgi:hypothetical protein